MAERADYRTLNPATGELVESFRNTDEPELDAALDAARTAFANGRRRPFGERANLLRRVARALREKAPELARTMAIEMGKPVSQGEGEAKKCAATCDYYADHGERMIAPEPREADALRSYVRFDPLGTVFAIMPWNFPFWQVFRFAAPAIAAGNVALLKHAENVPRCALAIEALFRDTGAPDGLFQSVFVDRETAGAMIADARVAAVTLTGSDRAGMDVGAKAGRALKKSVLELGGSDAFIVLEDADVARAAEVAADARLLNSGQSCIAAKRFLVVESIADRFIELFTASMARRKVGDPLASGTEVGPLARFDLRDNLHRQVEESVKRGGRLVLGGVLPSGAGAYYPPTVLTAVDAGMPAFDEETFGPVAAVVRVRDADEAIARANASVYGLGAAIWTADLARAERLAAELDVGAVFVNGFVKSDPRLPFGGVKRSGYGRELADFGLREFVNAKTVFVSSG